MDAYPTIFVQDSDGTITAHVPDLGVTTQGADLDEARAMAGDAIYMMRDHLLGEGRQIPMPSLLESAQERRPDFIEGPTVAVEAIIPAIRPLPADQVLEEYRAITRLRR